MTKKRLFSFLILAFVAGLLIGGVVGAVAQLEYMKRNPFAFPPPKPRSFKKAMFHRLCHELDLTDEQSKKIQPILESLHQDMEKLRMNNRPLINKHVESAQAKIEAFLSPEQTEKLRKFHEKVKSKFRHGKGKRHHRPKRHENSFYPPPPPPPSLLGAQVEPQDTADSKQQ